MKIIIDNNTTLYEIQKEFTLHFPYLKLKFFHLNNESNNKFSKTNMITDSSITLMGIGNVYYSGHININEKQKVISLENYLKKKFGINAQVFRKYGNTWLETITTNGLTLAEQNKEGAEMSKFLKEELVTAYDLYYEQI